jgi:hypothetical protein
MRICVLIKAAIPKPVFSKSPRLLIDKAPSMPLQRA